MRSRKRMHYASTHAIMHDEHAGMIMTIHMIRSARERSQALPPARAAAPPPSPPLTARRRRSCKAALHPPFVSQGEASTPPRNRGFPWGVEVLLNHPSLGGAGGWG